MKKLTDKYFFFDLETRSRVDLRKTGAYRYAEDPSTEILMMAYAVGDEPVQLVEGDAEARRVFAEKMADTDRVAVAMNAEFDLAVMGFTDFDRCEDTAAMAAILGYPRALGALATTLGVTEKLPEGKALIQLFSKPSRRKGAPFNDKDTHPEKWSVFVEYAKNDVVAMRDCYRLLEWPPGELEVWRANAKVNARGLPLDVDLAIAAEKVGEENTARMKAEMEQLLGIENAGSVAQLTAALGMPSMDKAAVSERLAAPDLPAHHRRALELRQSTALSSHKKFTAAKTAVCADGRGRGMFVYAAAGTGRFSSRTLQLQNLSREGFPDDLTTECVVEEVKQGFGASQAELRKLVRGMILGPIAVADYAQIEARMTSWLSDDQDALDVFRGGGDIYIATAERMSTATRKYSRQEGKTAVLGLGFGGGANALKNFGAEGSDEELWDIVNSWRKANHRTVRLWKDLWNGLLRGGQVRDNIRVERDGRDRGVVLPSGRTIWYRDIRKHGEEFSYANPERQGGRSKLYSGVVINNVVQGSARCITATAIKNAVNEGLDVIGHVHDEILTTGTDVTKLVEVMERPLPWSEGLPIKASGDVLPYRYRKA